MPSTENGSENAQQPIAESPSGEGADAPTPGENAPAPGGLALSEFGPRFHAFAQALSRPLVFFDIEATGTDPVADRIVEICVVRVNPPVCPGGGRGGSDGIEAPRTWRIDPQVRIPSEASEIHGIQNEDVQGAPTFAAIAGELEALFAGADLAGFSISRFDVRILHAEFVRAGHTIDFSKTRILDAQVIFHRREPRNLAAALRFYRDKELLGAHGAEADTVASLEVFAGQLERYDDPSLQLEDLHELSATHNDAYCDGSRRFSWRDGEPTFNFGRLRGKSLRWVAGDPNERKYLRWFLDGNFDEDAKIIVRDALEGRIRRRLRATA